MRCPIRADRSAMASGGTHTLKHATARREDGFTLIELLVATSLMLVVAAVVMSVMLMAFRQTDNQNDRVVALDDARNGLLRMQNEIRSASGLDSVSPQVLDVLVHFPEDVENPYHWIRYKCIGNDQGESEGLGGKCSRQDKTLNSGSDCAADGTGSGCVVILRNVVKYGQSHFAEPCDNYAAGGASAVRAVESQPPRIRMLAPSSARPVGPAAALLAQVLRTTRPADPKPWSRTVGLAF